MQDFLTQAIEFTAVIGFGYVVAMFVLSAVTVRKVERVAVAIPAGEFSCDADAVDAALVDGYMVTAALIDNVVPFVRPVKRPSLAGLSIRELKKLASMQGIKRYSNLNKSELVERLKGVKAA